MADTFGDLPDDDQPGELDQLADHVAQAGEQSAVDGEGRGRIQAIFDDEMSAGRLDEDDLADRVIRELSPQQLRGIGIDQTFLEEFKAQLGPDTSALVVLSGHEDLDEVRPVIERGLARGDVALMHAQLPHGALEILREAVRGLQKP